LVSLKGVPPDRLKVKNDDVDFYGKNYWLRHQLDDLQSSDIYHRSRSDLSERNLHWIKALLSLKLAPAKVLEVGCAHGSFVALMRYLGYDAQGLELSPWVVDFARKKFDIPIIQGEIENVIIPDSSLDAIVMMDVLEHLPNPLKTMKKCFKLLKEDGIILIQTPEFNPNLIMGELIEKHSPFLKMLIPDEHLYLFSKVGAYDFFSKLGAKEIRFMPPLFSDYDMFIAVSKSRIKIRSSSAIDTYLSKTNKLVLALLDIRERELSVGALLKTSDADRANRGQQIEELNKLLKNSDADRANRGQQIEELNKLLKVSDTDRAARGKQIEELNHIIKMSEADYASHLKQIEELNKLLKNSDADRANRGQQIEELTINVQNLFSRPAFKLFFRFLNWSEIKYLTELIKK
jgi:2-polyprenyl-3-methyl-5-hydroxy-6-metoxy-1,4-benzoquinol methylase